MDVIIQQERNLSQLSPHSLASFLYSPQELQPLKNHLERGPVLPYDPNIYNLSRTELMKDASRYLPLTYNHNQSLPKESDKGLATIYSLLVCPYPAPGGVHFGMFLKYIELMGTEEQKALYYEKARRCEITGSYAQTEVGHGSDVRSL